MPRILITRAPHQASALADGLRAHGFEPILIPTIELAAPTTFAPLDAAIASLSTYDWLLFTSANAVEAFAERLKRSVILSEGRSPQPKDLQPSLPAIPLPESFRLGTFQIAAIGPTTARAVAELLGTKPTLIPPQAIAESLVEVLIPHAKQLDGTPTRFLLIRAEQARDILPEALQKAGGEVTIAPAYCTVIPQDSVALIRKLFYNPVTYPDAITFTSSSTVTHLLALLNEAGLTLPADIKRISIGPVTSQTLTGHNIPRHAEASEATISSLIASILECFS